MSVSPIERLYVIQFGTGVDIRGQDPSKAAVRAVRDAVGSNTLPFVPLVTEGELDRLKVHVRLAVPPGTGEVDRDAVRAVLPVGTVSVEIVEGGLATRNGVGDTSIIVVAAVEVGI